jgi:molybdate transport repressor ModE-like protein
MDSRDLGIFVAVARCGSTLAASKQLGIGQSTVSRRIEALEEHLELTLFEKLPSGYVLTDAGRALLPQAEQVEQAVAKVVSSAKQHKRGLSGLIHFTTMELFGQTFIVPAMREFRAAYPDIQVDVILKEERLDLVAGEADVGVRSGRNLDTPGLVSRRIGRDRWAVYCSRTYAAEFGQPETAKDLAAHHVIGLSRDFPREPLAVWFDEAVPDAAVVVRQDSLPGLFAGLRSGAGVTLMSDLVASTDTSLLRCFEPPAEVVSEFDLWLVTTERLRHEPRIRALLDFLAGYFANARYRAKPP